MKRVLGSDSSNSMGALMSICPNSTDEGGNNNPGGGGVYSREFQAMMEDDDMNCMDGESCQGLQQLLGGSEKKRRLSVDQVKALEKNFEVENKLEPERKVKLAQELGLQPRQVAVWFQNRRARWKTKQLERDYGLLKATYDALKLDFDNLRHHNDALIKEIRELKSKAKEEYGKDDELMSDTELETSKQNAKEEDEEEEEALVLMKKSAQIKDPSSSDSCDSSAILNEDVNLGDGINIVKNDDVNFRFQESKVVVVASAEDYNHQQEQEQLVKIEEHNFFGEESCSTLFSDDQAPTLHWYEWS